MLSSGLGSANPFCSVPGVLRNPLLSYCLGFSGNSKLLLRLSDKMLAFFGSREYPVEYESADRF